MRKEQWFSSSGENDPFSIIFPKLLKCHFLFFEQKNFWIYYGNYVMIIFAKLPNWLRLVWIYNMYTLCSTNCEGHTKVI